MFKKIALAAALITSAAFATWDYYPVLEAGKGSAEAGMYYDWYHKWSQAGIKVGGRYSLIQGLEVSLQGWGYQLWAEEDCDHCANGGDGLRDLTLGVRYEIAPMITVFLDFNLPIGGDEVTNDEIALYGGAQFSMPINDVPGLKFGTEAGIFWGFAHGDNDYVPVLFILFPLILGQISSPFLSIFFYFIKNSRNSFKYSKYISIALLDKSVAPVTMIENSLPLSRFRALVEVKVLFSTLPSTF